MSANVLVADGTAAEARMVRRAARLQWLAGALGILGILIAIALVALAQAGDRRFAIAPELDVVGYLGTVVLFPVVGAVIARRRPFTRVAWVMILIGLCLGMGLLLFGYGLVGTAPSRDWPFALQALVLSQVFLIPSIGTGAAILLLLFPTDRLLSRRWRIVVAMALLGGLFFNIGVIFNGQPLGNATASAPNPISPPPLVAAVAADVFIVGNLLVTTATVLAAASVVVRYRRAEAVEAAQIRWIALVAAFEAPLFAIAGFQSGPLSDLAFNLGLLLTACLPIAIGIAITRYHLYDIDRIINRALVYGTLTAILAGVFTAAVGLAQRVFVATTGEKSDAAIVLTTLVVATLYAPLRKRLEGLVDMRFKYDDRRFGAYRDEVLHVLNVVDLPRAARRLAAEAVRELEATGGAVLGAGDVLIASAGTWPVSATIRLPLTDGRGHLGSVVVGPRVDGRPHDPQTVSRLEEVATLVATAVRAAN
jgi:hypothetical protein